MAPGADGAALRPHGTTERPRASVGAALLTAHARYTVPLLECQAYGVMARPKLDEVAEAIDEALRTDVVLRRELKPNGTRISWRMKGTFSAWAKMQRKGAGLEECTYTTTTRISMRASRSLAVA